MGLIARIWPVTAEGLCRPNWVNHAFVDMRERLRDFPTLPSINFSNNLPCYCPLSAKNRL